MFSIGLSYDNEDSSFLKSETYRVISEQQMKAAGNLNRFNYYIDAVLDTMLYFMTYEARFPSGQVSTRRSVMSGFSLFTGSHSMRLLQMNDSRQS